MATTTPIDIERYLLQGESDSEDVLGLKRTQATRVATKPPLEEALLSHYNSLGGSTLPPGQLPEPQPLSPETIQAGKTTLQKGIDLLPSVSIPSISMPSFGGAPTEPAPEPYISKRDQPISMAPTAERPPLSAAIPPVGTVPTPPPAKSPDLLTSLGEAAYTVTRDVAGGMFGAVTAVSDILNAQMARIAKGGPLAGGPESPTHYRDIFREMQNTVNSVAYEPQSDIAKTAHKAVGGVASLVGNVAELAGKAGQYLGLDEDRAKVLSFAAELYLFYKLDAGVRRAAPAIRAKISDFSERMSKMRSDGDFAASGAEGVAQDLYATVNRSPEASRALGEARQKLIGEADKATGTGPREPSPTPGGAPGGAAIDPAELQRYQDSLRTRTEAFKKANPEGFNIDELRAELAKEPQPQPRPAPEAPRAQAAPTMERPVQPEVVVGQDTAVARPSGVPPTEPIRPTAGGGTTTFRTEDLPPAPPITPDVINLRGAAPEAAATVAPETVPAPVSPEAPAVAAVPSSRQGYFGWEGTHTATSAIARAEELGVLNTIRTELSKGVALNDVAAIARQNASGRIQREEIYSVVEAIRNNPEATLAPLREMLNTGKLAELKSLAREAADGGNLITGITRLGFPREEARAIVEQLQKVRAKKAPLQQVAEKPAVQTASTEASLDAMPVGTEVEIPAPAEPVVDTSPIVEKPKRKRRIVKAPEATASIIPRTELVPGIPDDVHSFLLREGDATTTAISNRAGLTLPEANEAIRRLTAEGRVEAVQAGQFTRYHAVTSPTPAGSKSTYSTVDTVPSLESRVRNNAPITGSAEPTVTPIQLRSSTPGGKPNAIFLDTARLNTRTSLADVQAQTERGRVSTDVGAMMQANLARQAQLFERPLVEAHQFTGQELTREATRIAAANDLDLYVKKGKNYELVPKDVVRTDARLNNGDDLAPKPISSEAAGAYVESKTSDIGPDTIRAMQDAVEQGIDISDRLPAELVPHYQEMRERERAGIDESERRAFIDILGDLNTMMGEEGAIGGNFSYASRMAAQRLQADMRKAGKDTREFLFGARPQDVAMFEDYLDRINNPVPPDSTNPRNMRFDPQNVIPGDKVVKQRVVSGAAGTYAVPLWQSEVKGIQGARDIKPGGTPWDFKLPIRQHKAAGTEFLYYAYRTAQKNLNSELNDLHKGMEELSRGFSSRSLENVGANGYQRQGGDGQRILTFNKVTPRPLSVPEKRLQATLDGIYADLFNRVNETRTTTGREPLTRVDNYQTFARTISLLNHLGIKVDLARDTDASIQSKYAHYKATNFPYIIRKHAFYTAEMNALKILDTYSQAALKDIHLSPFLAKLHELIETNLPDPVTGKETWQLKDNKPGLYEELRSWGDYLATGTNFPMSPKIRTVLRTLNSNIAYSTLSYLIRSGGIQLSTLVNTYQALGLPATAKAVFANLEDHLTGGKQLKFALDNSEILSSRKFVDAYDQATAAIIGRRPRDFFHALRTGDFGSIQKALGRPGFKLLEYFDMQAAVMSWNAAYNTARARAMGYSHKDAVRFADDLVVRTQGSTMPGDLAGVQRNALGKLVTQFQTFLIGDFSFVIHEVLTKGKIGGGGGGQIPPGGVPSGTGSWETGGPRSNFQLAKNVIGFLIAVQLVNELYKLLHIQPGLPDVVGDVQKGIQQKHGPIGLAWDVAVGQLERLPVVGSMRYGKGMGGAFLEIARDLSRAVREDPMVRNPYEKQLRDIGLSKGSAKQISQVVEPAATLLGIPGTRQATKFAMAQKRGESISDSLLGWYAQTPGQQQRARPERRGRTR